MTFKPSHGLYSEEDFSSQDGFTFSNRTKQSVTGGFAALVPSVTRSASFLHAWSAVSGWDVNNSLNTRTAIEVDFTVSGGYAGIVTADSQSGLQRSLGGGAAWEISTPEIEGAPGEYSGQTYEYVSTEIGSLSQNAWHYRLNVSNDPFVIEFDVASTETVGTDSIAAIPSGQLTGLSGLTGISNHGVYISNGVNWDYLEVRPDGVRLYNHPEIAIPVSLLQPRRFRIGVDGNDIYVLNQNGQGLAGIGKFDTPITTGGPILAFGAPWTGHIFSFNTGTTVGFEGTSYWDNFKFLVGELAIDLTDGLESAYTTDEHTLYTPAFDAGIALKQWDSAQVDYVHKLGGTTTITPQYYTNTGSTDTPGWQSVDSAAVTLGPGTTARIDLSSIPAGAQVTTTESDSADQDVSFIRPTNQIRFGISQVSIDGTGPAPLVDKISVRGKKDFPFLETVPDWKPVDRIRNISCFVRPNKYQSTSPEPKGNSTFYFRASATTGEVTGSFAELSNDTNVGEVIGTGHYTAGKYDTSFQTYSFTTGSATTGSAAAELFGTNSIDNYIFDGKFNEPFQDVSALQYHLGGYTEGLIGGHLHIPTDFTNGARVKYSKHEITRLTESSPGPNFAQKVDILSVPSDELCGIEAVVPTGVSEDGIQAAFSFTLKTSQLTTNTALQNEELPTILVYGSGATPITRRELHGGLFTGGYYPVSIPLTLNGTGEGRLGIVASGSVGSFIVDDLQLAPISDGYLTCTGVGTYRTPFGYLGSGYSQYYDDPPANPYRASTVVSCDFLLDSYATGTNVLVQKLRDSDNRGLTLSINTSGYLECQFDLCHDAVLEGGYDGTFASLYNVSATTGERYLGQHTITGDKRVPIGYWTNIGFIHQTHVYRRFGGRVASGQNPLLGLAACNRAYLTIDGVPIASEDTMDTWVDHTYLGYTGNGNDSEDVTTAVPLPTYICDGTGTVTAASGLYCRVDNIHINRPAAADLESSLYIDAARKGVPYFLPDVFLKPGGADQDFTGNNSISDTDSSDPSTPNIYTANIWTLDNPKGATNFDHGATRNHLLFSGTVYKETGVSPYDGFNSTNFQSGYAKATYSSSLERLCNDATYEWDDLSTALDPTWPATGRLMFGSWIYARDTGKFFEITYDETSLNGEAITLELISSTQARAVRYDENGADVWAITGTVSLNNWHHVGLDYYWTGDYNHASPMASGHLVVDGTKTNFNSSASGAGFSYRGHSQSDTKSATYLARTADVNMADAFIAVNPMGYTSDPVNWSQVADATADKGGAYSQVYYDGVKFTGYVAYPAFGTATVTLPASTTPKRTNLWIGTNDYATDEGDNLDGIALYASTQFTEAESYTFLYSEQDVSRVFGSTDSPIRLGFNVPPHAINLARIDSPPYTVPGSITTIDLSDSNPGNLSTFRGGQFTLNKQGTVQRGNLVRKDFNGSFERKSAAATSTFDDYTVVALTGRKFDASESPFYGWAFGGGVDGDNELNSAYDIIPGARAGTAANAGPLDTHTTVTGGFVTLPIDGIHALGLHMAEGGSTEGIIASHSPLQLTSGSECLYTVSCYQPYAENNTTANIAFTVVGYTGYTGAIEDVDGTNVVCHLADGYWVSGSPIQGAPNEISRNATPNSTGILNITQTFSTTGFPAAAPEQYALWILHDDTNFLSTGEPFINFVVVDSFHLFEVSNSDASGTYQGIETSNRSGQFDWVFSDQVDTKDVRITSVSVTSPELDAPSEAYYAYLLGRGDHGVQIPDAFPHAKSGELTTSSVSGQVDQYISNIDSLRKRISVKSFDGKPIEDFQWDIVTSPFNYTGLLNAVNNQQSIALDGVGSGQFTGFLPDGVFSVIMVSPQLPNNGQTVFVHFPAYNFEDGTIDSAHREIFNPIPLMRETLDFETPGAGQYSLALNTANEKFYDLTVYGINGDFTGEF